MARINIRNYDGSLQGWFDDATTVEEVVEGKRWDGNNHRGIMSGLQIGYAEVIRTAKGRWVSHRNARDEYNGGENYEFITDDEARQWLLQAGTEEAERVLAKYFGEPEEEAGPNVGGRPEVGPAISVKYPQELLDRIEAARGATSRAQWLREAAEMRLSGESAAG